MKLVNAKVYTDGKFQETGIEFNEKITDISNNISADGDYIDCKDCYVIPGFVDIHSHAAVDCDASDGDPDQMIKMSKYYASRGVTSWCPTTMTLAEETLMKACKVINEFERPANGAKVCGINLEGPFINVNKKGAQNEKFVKTPDIEMFKRLYEASGEKVKLITMAPETEGAIEFIKEASKYATVSLGHTETDYDTAMAAYAAGASHTTHLFNAMPPLHHRNPGLIAAASDAGATIELICDGFHSHPAVVRLTDRLFGDKMVLISDSARCAGMPDGEYELGGLPIIMKDGKACLKGSDTIAGSTIHLMDGFLRSIKFGVSLEDAVEATSIRPAKVIKMDKEIGSIEKGKCADLLVLNKDLELMHVIIDGKLIER